MARQTGSKNLIPSEADRAQMLKALRRLADKGDPQAQGMLLLLAELRHREPRHAG